MTTETTTETVTFKRTESFYTCASKKCSLTKAEHFFYSVDGNELFIEKTCFNCTYHEKTAEEKDKIKKRIYYLRKYKYGHNVQKRIKRKVTNTLNKYNYANNNKTYNSFNTPQNKTTTQPNYTQKIEISKSNGDNIIPKTTSNNMMSSNEVVTSNTTPNKVVTNTTNTTDIHANERCSKSAGTNNPNLKCNKYESSLPEIKKYIRKEMGCRFIPDNAEELKKYLSISTEEFSKESSKNCHQCGFKDIGQNNIGLIIPTRGYHLDNIISLCDGCIMKHYETVGKFYISEQDIPKDAPVGMKFCKNCKGRIPEDKFIKVVIKKSGQITKSITKECEDCRSTGRKRNKLRGTQITNETKDTHMRCNECESIQLNSEFLKPPKEIATCAEYYKSCLKCRERKRIIDNKPSRLDKKAERKRNNPEDYIRYNIVSRLNKIKTYGIENCRSLNKMEQKRRRELKAEAVYKYGQEYGKRQTKILSDYKSKCIRRGTKWLLEDDYAFELLFTDCFYCGYRVDASPNGIDRIESDGDYTKDNCVACCKMCNYTKGCLDIVTFIKRSEYISVANNRIAPTKINEDIFHNYKSCSYEHYRYRAYQKNIGWNLTEENVIAIKKRPCYICKRQAKGQFSNGIDRIDNTKGYSLSNCASCCGECNYMKKDFNIDVLLDQMLKIYNHSFKKLANFTYDEKMCKDNIKLIKMQNQFIISSDKPKETPEEAEERNKQRYAKLNANIEKMQNDPNYVNDQIKKILQNRLTNEELKRNMLDEIIYEELKEKCDENFTNDDIIGFIEEYNECDLYDDEDDE